MKKTKICTECSGLGIIMRDDGGDYGNGCGWMKVWNEPCDACGGTGFIEVPMTYADRIRTMTDEELADLLTGNHPLLNRRFIRKETALAWLQEPVMEVKNEA